MSDAPLSNIVKEPTQPKSAQQKDVEAIRDLFARAHDYIAQASHPGHLGMKVAEVLNFLAFQYNDFKVRAENLAKQVEAEAKAELSKVDIDDAKAKVEAVLNAQQTAFDAPATVAPDAPQTAQDSPKA